MLRRLASLGWLAIVLVALPLTGQTYGSFTVNGGSGQAGSTFRFPLTLITNSGINIDTLTFGVTLTANGQAPAITSLSVSPAALGPPQFQDTSVPGALSVFWNNISPPATGTVAVGSIAVTIPSSAVNGQTYTLRVTKADGSQGNEDKLFATGPDVTLTVVGSNGIALSPNALQFTAQQNAANPQNQPVTLTNPGGLNWNAVASSAGSWLVVTPTSGSGNATLAVSVITAGLTPNTYNGTVQVTAPGIALQTINVTLTITAPVNTTPAIALSSTSLTFSGQSGGANPASQSVSVSNSASGTLNWTAAVTSGAWLSVTSASGTNSGTFNVAVNLAGLAAGTYNGAIQVSATGASNSPRLIPVTLTVTGAAPSITLSSGSLTFNATQGGANPPSQGVVISCGSLNWTASATPAGGFLSVSPASGACGGTLTVSTNTSGLLPGNYTGAIQVSATGATNSPQAIPVTLNVTSATSSVITLKPTSLQFSATAGSNPSASQTFQVLNNGTGTLAWTATVATQSGGTWLALNPTAGTAPSTLTVSVASASLFRGLYQGAITITATGIAANSPQTIPVILSVDAPLIGQNGIVNGASFSSAATVSPGSIASLFGTSLSLATQNATTIPLPTGIAGTQVLVNGVAAPLFYVSPSQINFQIPFEATGATPSVAVVSAGITSFATTVNSQPAVPGIFTTTSSGSGQGAVLNADFSQNSTANPAVAGTVVQIFATGLGATNPAAATGQPGASAEPLNRTNATPIVTIGGVQADMLYSGLAPGFIGLYQVNVHVPAGLSGGAVAVQIQVGGQSSNVATIAVR